MNPEMNQEMNSEKNPEVFISYSSSDADKAIQVKSVLEENGFTCWMDTERIKSGSDYTDDIPTAIYGCRALVIIMSENSQKSKWVKNGQHGKKLTNKYTPRKNGPPVISGQHFSAHS